MLLLYPANPSRPSRVVSTDSCFQSLVGRYSSCLQSRAYRAWSRVVVLTDRAFTVSRYSLCLQTELVHRWSISHIPIYYLCSYHLCSYPILLNSQSQSLLQSLSILVLPEFVDSLSISYIEFPAT